MYFYVGFNQTNVSLEFSVPWIFYIFKTCKCHDWFYHCGFSNILSWVSLDKWMRGKLKSILPWKKLPRKYNHLQNICHYCQIVFFCQNTHKNTQKTICSFTLYMPKLLKLVKQWCLWKLDFIGEGFHFFFVKCHTQHLNTKFKISVLYLVVCNFDDSYIPVFWKMWIWCFLAISFPECLLFYVRLLFSF